MGRSPAEEPRAGTAPAVGEERMPRIDSLTGLRWWAAFVVFAHHLSGFAPLPSAISAVFYHGYFGVTFFFVLSGFVLTWSWSPALRTSTFYWRRVARIYPSHVVALLVAIPVFTVFQPDPSRPWALPFDIIALLLALVLLQGWSTDPAIVFAGNPAAWSLTYEAFFYATHPFISRGLRRVGVRGALILAGILIVGAFLFRAGTRFPPTELLAFVPPPVQHLWEFVLGMALAWAVRRGWRPRIPVSVGLGALALSIAPIVLVPRYAPGSTGDVVANLFSNELVTVACGIAIVAFASRSVRGKSSVFAHPVMVRLGEWSYAFYLLHATVIYAALALFGPQQSGWFNLVWYLVLGVISVAASAALHLLVEKPAERRMRRWKDRRDERARAAAAVPPSR